jgi:mRNA-degrading endonuclease HigB of HigAB toxin-antitoxin module
LSFHGIPARAVDRGDPYRDECLATGRLLARALCLDDETCPIAFQSRFGFARWLQPYTAATLEDLGRRGIGRVDVLCPGFPADCLETLEEIAVAGKSVFLNAGGREYFSIPCLNESEEWIRALETLVLRNIAIHDNMRRMKLISNRALREFATRFPEAEAPLKAFRMRMESGTFHGFADLAATFPYLDKVGDKYVFNLGGNKFRLVAGIAFSVQIVWIKAVMTHDEYDQGKWK